MHNAVSITVRVKETDGIRDELATLADVRGVDVMEADRRAHTLSSVTPRVKQSSSNR